MGSCGVVLITRVRPGGRWLFPRLICSLARTLSVVGFIRGCWVPSRVPWRLLGSSGVVWFICAYPRDRCVYPESLGSLTHALVVVVFSRAHHGCRWIQFHSNWCLLGSSGFGGFSLAQALGGLNSSRFVGFTFARPEGRYVHPETLRSLVCVLGVVGFSRYRCVHFRAPWRSSGSSGVVGFIQVRSGCRWVHQL